MRERTILYGVCGIGNGHTLRQLPLIEHFAESARIVIFAYESSYGFYSDRFAADERITVLEVAVPYYVGNRDGIDFDATRTLGSNRKDYATINGRAMAEAERVIGTPDIVISDYEPVCARYAYGHGSPLVTIDQQSKYLIGRFPEELHGRTYLDETARLKLFFPEANERIACSFFDVPDRIPGYEVRIFAPILRESVVRTVNVPDHPDSILVYLTAQDGLRQDVSEIVEICRSRPDIRFDVFAPDTKMDGSIGNVSIHRHGSTAFDTALTRCSGIVSTAGHTLLSEAMHLGIPVFAMPLPEVYEQQMNAEVIDRNGFGSRHDAFDRRSLGEFVDRLDGFREAIRRDADVLLRGDGKSDVIRFIETKYFSA
ncbi:MAG: hypothetical protein HGA31_02520 [Candidatus Moranbacteria bacterium]|nr:hypothetical protein [Candidatus Moranbacteria bacterium]